MSESQAADPDAPLTDEQMLDMIANAKPRFGLVAQGHIPTIEKMLADGADWQAIAARIGWTADAATKAYARHEADQSQKARMDKLSDGEFVAYMGRLIMEFRPKFFPSDRVRLRVIGQKMMAAEAGAEPVFDAPLEPKRYCIGIRSDAVRPDDDRIPRVGDRVHAMEFDAAHATFRTLGRAHHVVVGVDAGGRVQIAITGGLWFNPERLRLISRAKKSGQKV